MQKLQNENYNIIRNWINSKNVKRSKWIVDVDFNESLAFLDDKLEISEFKNRMILPTVNDLSDFEHLNIIIYPKVASCRSIGTLMEKLKGKCKVNLAVVGEKNRVVETALKLRWDCFDVEYLPIGFSALEDDLFVLEHSVNSLRDYRLNFNFTSLKSMAKQLVRLEKYFGRISVVKLKGAWSEKVWKYMMKMRKEKVHEQKQTQKLILLDRSVDFAAIFMTPLTYEAVIDHVIGIHAGGIVVDAIQDEENSGHTKTNLRLDAKDVLFEKLRNCHMEGIGQVLQKEAIKIRNKYEQFRNKSKMASVSELSELVKRMPRLKQNYQLLQYHTELVGQLLQTTQSAEFRQKWTFEHNILTNQYADISDVVFSKDLMTTLMLYALKTALYGGIPQKEYDELERNICRRHGFKYKPTLENLQKAGILAVQKHSSNRIDMVRKEFQQCRPKVDTKKGDDAAYVTSGYAPLIARMVEKIVEIGDWKSCANVLKQLPGPTAEVSTRSLDSPNTKQQKSIVVCIVGGITFAEVATIRNLARQHGTEITICSTSMINGEQIISSMFEPIHNGLIRQ